MPEGVEFPFPSLLFHEGRTYGQPEVVRISLPQVATGLRSRLPGSFRRRAFHVDLLMPKEALFARGAHSLQAVMHRALLCRGRSGRYLFLLGKRYLPEIKAGYGRKGETDHGNFSLYSKDCWTQQRKIHHIGICLSQWRCDEK